MVGRARQRFVAAGQRSRRIDETHRLVYAADDADLDVIACRGHYDD